jgi:hypothetical protein
MKKVLHIAVIKRRWNKMCEGFYNQMNQLINLKGELAATPLLRQMVVTLRKSVTSSRAVRSMYGKRVRKGGGRNVKI